MEKIICNTTQSPHWRALYLSTRQENHFNTKFDSQLAAEKSLTKTRHNMTVQAKIADRFGITPREVNTAYSSGNIDELDMLINQRSEAWMLGQYMVPGKLACKSQHTQTPSKIS